MHLLWGVFTHCSVGGVPSADYIGQSKEPSYLALPYVIQLVTFSPWSISSLHFRATVKSVLLYGDDTWRLRKDVCYTRKCLRVHRSNTLATKECYGDIDKLSNKLRRSRFILLTHTHSWQGKQTTDIFM